MRHIPLLLLGCAISCAVEPQADVFQKPHAVYLKLTNPTLANFRNNIMAGINETAGCEIVLSMNDQKRDDILVVPIMFQDGLKMKDNYIGEFDHFYKYIMIDSMFNDPDQFSKALLTVVHELGHAFGLRHEDGTIMNPYLLDMTINEAYLSLISLLNEHDKNLCAK